MTDIETLKEATRASLVFSCFDNNCNTVGELKDSFDKGVFIRSLGALKGAISGIPEVDISTIIIHGIKGCVGFTKIKDKYYGLLWKDKISTIHQIKRIEAVAKTILELRDKPQEEPEEVPKEIQKDLTEKETRDKVEEALDFEEVIARDTLKEKTKQTDAITKEPQKKIEEESEKKVDENETVFKRKSGRKDKKRKDKKVFIKKIEEPKEQIFYKNNVIEFIESIIEEYLEDFAYSILENEIKDSNIDLDKSDKYNEEKIETLLIKLHDSASMIIGPTQAKEMDDKIKNKIKEYIWEK